MRLLLAESSAVVLALAYCVGGVVDYNGSYVATTSTTSRRVTPVAACSAVASSWAAQTAATPIPTVNAGLAYECINSAPLKKDAALKFIDELKPYLEWQSGLAFLQNPPADYFFPPHNVFAALDGIRAGLEADEYGNEYAWQQDMFVKVFGPAHDGHLHVYPDILTNAMEWARPFALVSISEDGSSAPVIKIYDDVVSSPDTASVLSFINGIDVATFIEDWAFKVTGSRDPDSAYSSMFYSKAVAVSGGTGHFKQGGRIRFIYPGTVTSFTFENGSFLELPNVARLKGDWSGVVDGPTFFNRFAPGAAEGVADAATIAARSSAKPSSTPTPASLTGPTGINGYPAPLAINGNAAVSGYFIDESGFDDVAVLALRSFGSKHPGEFQKAVEEFFTTAVRAGKTKLVVDLQVNGGGYILQGYDTSVIPRLPRLDTCLVKGFMLTTCMQIPADLSRYRPGEHRSVAILSRIHGHLRGIF